MVNNRFPFRQIVPKRVTWGPFMRSKIRRTDIGCRLHRPPIGLFALDPASLEVVPKLIRRLELIAPTLLVRTHLEGIRDAGTRLSYILKTMRRKTHYRL